MTKDAVCAWSCGVDDRMRIYYFHRGDNLTYSRDAFSKGPNTRVASSKNDQKSRHLWSWILGAPTLSNESFLETVFVGFRTESWFSSKALMVG